MDYVPVILSAVLLIAGFIALLWFDDLWGYILIGVASLLAALHIYELPIAANWVGYAIMIVFWIVAAVGTILSARFFEANDKKRGQTAAAFASLALLFFLVLGLMTIYYHNHPEKWQGPVSTPVEAPVAAPTQAEVAPTVEVVFTSTPTGTPIPTTLPPTLEPTIEPTTIPSAIPATIAPVEQPQPEPVVIDYGVSCWPEEPNTTFAATGGMGYREYLISQYKGDGKFYHLPYSTLMTLTAEVPGWVVFEGRPDESNGADHTYVYSLDVNRVGDFVFQEGSFHFFKWAQNGCPNTEALMVGIDRLMSQKWATRLEGNELAGLKGFQETAMLIEDGEILGTFDKDHPYEQLTKYNLDGTNTCNELTAPRRVEYFGEQRGEYKNFSFGAPSCRSVAVGVFKSDAVFAKDGFQARFYNGAMDNQMAKTGEGLINILFPTDWSGPKIADWVLTNLVGVTAEDFQDPEGVVTQ